MLSIRARSEHIQGCNFQVCIHVRVKNVPHGDFFSTRALKIEVPSISDTLRAIDKLKVADSIHLVPSCVSYLRPFEQIKILLRVLGLPVSGSRSFHPSRGEPLPEKVPRCEARLLPHPSHQVELRGHSQAVPRIGIGSQLQRLCGDCVGGRNIGRFSPAGGSTRFIWS